MNSHIKYKIPTSIRMFILFIYYKNFLDQKNLKTDWQLKMAMRVNIIIIIFE